MHNDGENPDDTTPETSSGAENAFRGGERVVENDPYTDFSIPQDADLTTEDNSSGENADNEDPDADGDADEVDVSQSDAVSESPGSAAHKVSRDPSTQAVTPSDAADLQTEPTG